MLSVSFLIIFGVSAFLFVRYILPILEKSGAFQKISKTGAATAPVIEEDDVLVRARNIGITLSSIDTNRRGAFEMLSDVEKQLGTLLAQITTMSARADIILEQLVDLDNALVAIRSLFDTGDFVAVSEASSQIRDTHIRRLMSSRTRNRPYWNGVIGVITEFFIVFGLLKVRQNFGIRPARATGNVDPFVVIERMAA